MALQCCSQVFPSGRVPPETDPDPPWPTLFLKRIKTIYIDSYSSKTGEWSVVSTLELPRTAYLRHEPSVVANGIVHWRAMDGRIVVYNPSDGDRHVQLINMPHYHKQDSFTFTRSADNDVLWLAVQLGKKLLIYTLPKERDYKREVAIGEEEWELMEEVSIFDISRIRKKALVACKRTTLECLIPEPRDEIVAVLRQEEKLFFYNVQSKSIAKVEYCGRYNNRHRLHPYFQPSFLSSACL